MKLILSTILSFNLYAQCDYFIEKDSILYAGYTLYFSQALDKYMGEAGYHRVYDNSYDYKLIVDAFEYDAGRFKKAQSNFKLFNQNNNIVFQAQNEKTCLTQYCAISDIGKSLNKLFRKRLRKLPKCTKKH